MTNQSTGSASHVSVPSARLSGTFKNSGGKNPRSAGFLQHLIVALGGLVAFASHPSAAQQVTYYDFNTVSANPNLISTACTTNSAPSGVLFCFNNANGGLGFVQDNSYTTIIDPNATTGSAYALQLTQQNVQSQSSSVWYSTPQNVAGGFTAWYAFKITPGSSPYGDGLAFVIQNSLGGGTDTITNTFSTGGGLNILGGSGGGLGYAAIDNSVALEADTFADSFDPYDIFAGYYDDSHLALQSCGAGLANSPAHYTDNSVSPLVPTGCMVNLGGIYAIASYPTASSGAGRVTIADGSPHQVVVVYNGPNDSPANYIYVYLDPVFVPGTHTPVSGSTPIIAGPYNITNSINLNSGNAYIGFTAATGGSFQQNELMGFSFTPHGFGNINVCPSGQSTPSPCSNTLPVNFTFASSTTIGSVKVVTQGTTGLDFQQASGSTCSAAVTSCTVNVTFAPLAPGLRMGAVQLLDDSGNVLATQLIYGTGQAPELVYSPTISGGSILDGPSLENVVSIPGYAPPTFNARAMATDAAGDLFIADPTNGRVVELPANGTTSTVGVGLGSPQALAVDGAGSLFIADTGLQEVLAVPAGCTSSACQTVVYKAAVGAPAGVDPVGLTVDGMGDLFIADGIAGVIEIPAGCATSSCQISVGSGWSSPSGLAIDAAGDLFVADSGLGKVLEMPVGCTVNSCQIAVGSGWLYPHGVAVDAAGDVYVADSGLGGGEVLEVPAGCANNTCEVALLSGNVSYDVAVDAAGEVYVANATTNQVLKINQAGTQTPSETFPSEADGMVSSPQSFTILNAGTQTLNSSGMSFPYFWYQVDLNGNPPDCSTSFSLAPGQSCNFSLVFAAKDGGPGDPWVSAIWINDNNLNGSISTQQFLVDVSGIIPAIDYTLTVAEAGSGSGTVTDDSNQISCSGSNGSTTGTCSGSYENGTIVTLTANPAAGSTFAGWGGSCANAGMTPTCAVTVNGASNAIANFALVSNVTLSVTEVGTGSGTVADNLSRITCSQANGVITGTCTANYTSGTSVTLTATPSGNSIFAGWGGVCANSGANPTCNVTMNSASNATASFVAPGATQSGTLKPITAGVVYGQNGSFTSSTGYGVTSANSLYQPENLAVDSNGNLYVADLQNSRVLFYPAGSTTATRVYGQGGSFTTGGGNYDGVSADSLNNPYGIAVDNSGGLYVADENNNRVLYYSAGSTTATRVYGQNGNFTTNYQNMGGAPSANSLNGPQSVALDSNGNLYVADTLNSRVLFYPAGSTTATQVYGQAGDLTSAGPNLSGISASSLNNPFALTLDSSGNLYVADSDNNRVLFYPFGSTTATQVYGQNGSFTSGAANNAGVTASSLNNPQSVTLDSSGNLYVSDYNNNRVLFYPFGSTTATRVYGQGGSFTSSGAHTNANSLSNPAAVALDSSGNLYVADKSNNRVVEYGPFGNVNVCSSGQSSPAPCNNTITLSYSAPSATTFGATQVVTQGATGLDFTLGSGSTCVGSVSAGSSCLVNVKFAPLAPGLRMGAVQVLDNGGNSLASAQIYGAGQGPLLAIGSGTQTTVNTGNISLAKPNGVAVDAAGDVFIADSINQQVVKVAANGATSTLGVGLQYPQGLAVDGAGDLFIADNNLNTVVEVPAGCTNASCQKNLTGNPPGAQLGVAVDGLGDVFAASFNGEVVKVPANGGAPSVVYNPPGSNPIGLAADAKGDLFIADFGLAKVVEIPSGCASSSCQISVGTGWVQPEAVAVDAAGNIYVADEAPKVVEVPAGCNNSACQITISNLLAFGIAVDASGDIFIPEETGNQVVKISRSQTPSFSFATTKVDSTSTDSPQLVSIQNIGNQSLTGSLALNLGGGFTQNNSTDCASQFPLAPGAVCNESFSFTPPSATYFTGTAVFTDNTLNGNPPVAQTINLSGTGQTTQGVSMVVVPDVVGQTQTAAATPISGAGLVLGTVTTQSSDTVPSGSVISETPAAGTQVSVGSAVNLLVSTGQPQPPSPNPLLLENNYFVTGDYASAGVTLRGTGIGGVATGNITITSGGQGVPDGADIIDAFLYWETIENTASPSSANGTFRGYSITGQQIGTDIPNYTDGVLTGTLRMYRADVNLYFAAQANGVRYASGTHSVSLPDGGGSALPVTEGASLVVIYRVLSPNFPLKSVVIYDGSAVPTTAGMQVVQGFYDAVGGANGAGKNTNIFASGGTWNNSVNSVTLGQANQFNATLNTGSAYEAVILSTLVNNSDNDGILDAWKAGPAAGDFHAGQPGYYDVKSGSWVPLPGAKHGEKDLFVQLDYMCTTVNPDGSCASGPGLENLFPSPDISGNDPLAMVQQAFAASGVQLHLQIGNAVPEDTCTDAPGQPLCQFPSQPGVIGWKNSLEISKLWPRNLASCVTGGDCTTRFAYGQKDSYHYVLFGHSLAVPAWNTRYGTLTSIQVASGVTTISTADRGTGINQCPSRVTISGVLGNPSLNGVYNTTGCADSKTISLNTPGVPNWSYPNNSLPEPVIGLTSGTITSISGYSDLGGADSAVTLGLWLTAPNQDMSKKANVIAGTLFHEIGHTLGLSHGGLYYDGAIGNYVPTFEANCKPNYQSVMNYLFQLDLVGPSQAVAFSNQTLTTLNESSAGSISQLTDVSSAAATFPTSAWYVPVAPGISASPATRHCDGTPLAGDSSYRVDASIAPITPPWSNGQDINFDGQLNAQMRGFNDLTNMDLRQVGATGGEFASLASVLSFGSSAAPLNIGAGGNVVLGSGGTVALGSGGTVTLGSGGNVTLGSGGTITLGSGGNVTLGSGGNVTLGSGGVVTPGSSGIVTLGSGGNVTLGSGGTITLGSGGNVILGSGGTVTLGSGGTIALGNGGGTVTIPSTGGSYTLDSAGGTITLGSGGNVTLGSGGNVTLGSGGTIALGSGGNVTLGSGGNVTLGSGGTIALGSGGTVALGSGGNVTLGSGGTIALGSGGTVTLGSGGNVTLGSGGTVTLGSGGDLSGSGGNVTLGSGGNVTLGSGGTVTLGSGGNVTLGSGGNVTLGSGGTITLGSGGNVTLGSGGTVTLGSGGTVTPSGGSPVVIAAGGSYTFGSSGGIVALGSGGNVTLGSGGNVTLGSGGTITLGSGGTVTLGSGGNVTLGSGGVVALGSGGNVTLGSGGTIALGSGGNVTLGSGGTLSTELTYETANSVVRPPSAPTETPISQGVRVDWNAPVFGVVQTYTIYRSSNGATPIAIGSVSGNPPATEFIDTNPDLTSQTVVYTISTTLAPVTLDPTQRQSPPSPPAVLKNDQTINIGPLPSSVVLSATQTIVTATSMSGGNPNGLQVSFNAAGPCAIVNQSVTPIASGGVSSATVALNNTGSCTITASQPGTDVFNAANSVSGTFMILPAGSNTSAQTITFAPLQNSQYGNSFLLSASSSSGLQVSFAASGPCTTSGKIIGVGVCKITASAPGNGTYSAASATQSFIIYPAVLKVTANSFTITHGQSLPALTYTYSGFVNSETPAVVSGAPALSTTATSASNAGAYPITVSTGSLAAANYSFLYVSGTLTIQESGQTITFTTNPPASAAFNSIFTVAATSTSQLPVVFTSAGSCSNVGATFTMTNSTGTCSVIANQPGNTNYSAAPQVTKFVNATGPVVTVSPASINFGTVPQGSITTKGITVSNVGTAPVTINQPVLSIVQGGNSNEFVAVNLCPNPLAAGKSCTITIAFVAGPYYTPQSATLQIMDNAPGSPQPVMLSALVLIPQTITFVTNPPASAANKSSFTVAATGGASGNPVTFTSSGVCSITGTTPGTATYAMNSSTGSCSVIANQAGNSSYAAAAQVTKTVTATPIAQAITFTTNPPASAVYKSSFIVAATGGASGNPVTFTSSGACSNAGATYTMTSGMGTCSVIANQAGNASYAAAAPITKTVTATQAAQTITFTTNPPASAVYKSSFTVAATGGASGNPVTFTSSGACSNAGANYTMTSGAGTCSVTANQAGNSNYSAAAPVTKAVNAVYAVATLSPASLSFGTVTSGKSSSPKTVTLSNTGTTPLIIISIGFTGANPGNFVQTNTCPSASSSLAAGKSCTISVTFNSGGKAVSANLSVTDNTQAGTQTLSLSGN
ncbi:choice-of-anchor D domain-containing protein [Telmatobacter sp. DSM 110680]|uniref:Choice-of-anchor D domain-containing protein n=1 Tax=Telmatobacter sp. DSM 110680 TaxID=3036704 RepID=A0AAU7DKS0_9BACT